MTSKALFKRGDLLQGLLFSFCDKTFIIRYLVRQLLTCMMWYIVVRKGVYYGTHYISAWIGSNLNCGKNLWQGSELGKKGDY